MHSGKNKLDLSGWITVTEAQKLTGYNAEYLRQLARRGAIQSQKISRIFLIERDSLLKHQKDMALLGSQKFSPTRKS